MSVRESLELDMRQALASTAQLDRNLTAAARGFTTELNRGIGQLGRGTTGLGPLRDDIDRTRRTQQEQEEQTKRNEASLQRLGTAAGIAGAAIAAGIGLAIARSIEFERVISTVGAVSDASSRQLDRLRDAAIEAGAATIFSARDAAEAEAELAKAGLTTSQILGGALTGALDLAAAGQLDLATAATISAQAMAIFNLEGEDVTHIADVLAAGANKSTASVSSLGEGLGNAGGAARLANLGLEETVGVLALLDQNAVRGAEGGTALRSALLQLFTPSQKQADEMARVGFSAFDAGGKFIGLERLAGELQARFGGLTQEQRNLSLGIIFGSFGIQAATTLYRAGAEGVREYTNSVNDQGAASRFASTQLDNLAGDLEQLKGSIETALIQNGGQATTVLRFMARSATQFTNAFASVPGPLQAAGGGIAALAAAGLLGFSVFTRFNGVLGRARTELDGLNPAARTAVTSLGRVAIGMGGVVTAAASFQTIDDSAEGITTGLLGMAAGGAAVGAAFGNPAIGAAAGVFVGIGKAIFEAGESTEEFQERIAGLGKEIETLGTRQAAVKFLDDFGGSVEGLAESLALAAENVERPGRALVAGFGGNFDTARNAILNARDQINGFRRDFAELARTNPGAAERVLEGIRAIRNEGGQPILPGRVIAELERNLQRGERAFSSSARNARDARDANNELAGSVDNVALASDEAMKAYDDYVKGLSAGTPTISGVFSESVTAAENWAKEVKKAFDPQALLNDLLKQQEGIRNFTSNVRFLMENGLEELAGLVAEKGPIAGANLAQALRDASPEVRSALNDTVRGANHELNEWNRYMQGTLAPALADTSFAMGFGVSTGVKRGVEDADEGAIAAAVAMANDVNTALFSASAGAYGIGIDVGTGLGNGMYGSLDYATNAAYRMALDTAQAMAFAFGIASPSKVTMKIGEQVGLGLGLGMLATEGFVDNAARRLSVRATAGARTATGGGFVGPSVSTTTIDRSINTQVSQVGGTPDRNGAALVRHLRVAAAVGRV